MTVTRVGEFAWSRMEPSENHIDLDCLHAPFASLKSITSQYHWHPY